MTHDDIKALVALYNSGPVSDQELNDLAALIEAGKVDLTELHDLERLNARLMQLDFGPPSRAVDDAFYTMLASEKRKEAKSSGSWFAMPQLWPRLTLAAAMVVIGFLAGYWVHQPAASSAEVRSLTSEVNDLKEMMMLSLLEKDAATERLRAVNLTHEMEDASNKVTHALIQTLNNDENVNVRLAALEALKPYTRDSKVRKELIASISKQSSPLVQVALAELMAKLQEKSSVKALQKILDNEKTPADVKKKIEETIQIMI